MIFSFRLSFFVALAIVSFSCKKERKPASAESLAQLDLIIPKPVSIAPRGMTFALTAETKIHYRPELKVAADELATILRRATGLPLPTNETESAEEGILLALSDTLAGQEEYVIDINDDIAIVAGRSAEGVFRGLQTFRQLFPAKIEATTGQPGPWEIATARIVDYPAFRWRGTMLDVARHFFGVDDVKRFIDLVALYKINVVHLHLSDDQGWRIEIKSRPELTRIGSTREVGGGEGGYFTQEQYKEIVNYAADRFITIVPEIDLPGHTNAALASYGELNCDRKPSKLYTGTSVGFSSLCPGKEASYQFVDDVMRELAAITPGPYLHIGGDEAHSTKKKDYIAFIDRFQKIVQSHGKKMMGWEEIAQATVDSTSVAQHWAKASHAQTAAGKNLKLVMSPAKKTYLDMKYDSTTKLGLKWAAYIEVDSSYLWNPESLIPGVHQHQILGVEAPLWSETIKVMDDIEYLLFPRLPALAEVGWTASPRRSWDDFRVRLGAHGPRFRQLGINFYPSKQIPWRN